MPREKVSDAFLSRPTFIAAGTLSALVGGALILRIRRALSEVDVAVESSVSAAVEGQAL